MVFLLLLQLAAPRFDLAVIKFNHVVIKFDLAMMKLNYVVMKFDYAVIKLILSCWNSIRPLHRLWHEMREDECRNRGSDETVQAGSERRTST